MHPRKVTITKLSTPKNIYSNPLYVCTNKIMFYDKIFLYYLNTHTYAILKSGNELFNQINKLLTLKFYNFTIKFMPNADERRNK